MNRWKRRHLALWPLALGLILAANGCAKQPDDAQDPLAIIGIYHDNFGCTQTITAETWTTTVDPVNFCGGIYHIAVYLNGKMFLIAQNDHTNAFAPDLWSRFDWVTSQGHLYYCQTAFGAASEADARNTPRSDDTHPATGGCGGAFPWTQLN